MTSVPESVCLVFGELLSRLLLGLSLIFSSLSLTGSGTARLKKQTAMQTKPLQLSWIRLDFRKDLHNPSLLLFIYLFNAQFSKWVHWRGKNLYLQFLGLICSGKLTGWCWITPRFLAWLQNDTSVNHKSLSRVKIQFMQHKTILFRINNKGGIKTAINHKKGGNLTLIRQHLDEYSILNHYKGITRGESCCYLLLRV